MSDPAPVVFLVDVDNTLLDNDAALDALRQHVQRELGLACWERYRTILVALWEELGYRDYLGALQRYRDEHTHDVRLPRMSLLMQNYAFERHLYPGALEVVNRLRSWGTTVIMTDGDVIFQPRKVQQSGLWHAVGGRVLIYVHKERELADVEMRYPANHYVLIDDKLTILTAVKRTWGTRVTTVFPRQGRYALDPQLVASHPAPDVTISRISDLLQYDLSTLLTTESMRPVSNQNLLPFQARSRRTTANSPLSRSEQP